MLFPNFKNTLLDFSSKLDGKPRLLAYPLLLGIDFVALSNTKSLDQLLVSIGFSLESSGLWKRESEHYENHFSQSRQGYMSLGEVDEWCKLLCQRCIDQNVSLFLPLGEEILSYDLEPIKLAFKGLMDSSVNLRIVYNPLAQPKDQAALVVSLDLIDWSDAWIVLFEDMFFRGAFTTSFVSSAMQVIGDELELDGIIKILNKLASKKKHNVAYGDILTKEHALKELHFLIEHYR